MGIIEEQPLPQFTESGLRIIYVESGQYCQRCAALEEAIQEVKRLKAEVAKLQRNAFIRRY